MSSKIRNRENPNLDIPTFDAGFKFSAGRARFDKLEVNLDLGWIKPIPTKQIHQQFLRIADSSNLFNCDGSESSPALTISRKDDWLFTGKIGAARDHRNDIRIKAYLTINATRYFANNPPNRPRLRGRHARFYRLKCYHPAHLQIARERLDGNDNLIIRERLREANEKDWKDNLSDLVEDITALIEDHLIRFSSGDIFVFQHLHNWTVKSAEIYWEFETPNAALVAESFGDHAANYFRRHRKRMHLSEVDYRAAYKSFIFEPTRKGISIALYAKTANRIRVECRFTSRPKSIYKDLSDANYPRERIEPMYDMLYDMVAKAQKELAPLREAHREYDPDKFLRRAEVVGSLAALSYMAGHNQILLQDIFQKLLTNGRISETSNNAFNQMLAKMADRGLLKPYTKRPRQPRAYGANGVLTKLLSALN